MNDEMATTAELRELRRLIHDATGYRLLRRSEVHQKDDLNQVRRLAKERYFRTSMMCIKEIGKTNKVDAYHTNKPITEAAMACQTRQAIDLKY